MDRAVQLVYEATVTWFGSLPELVRILIALLGIILAGAVYLARAVKKIEQGDIGMRLWWGMVILRYNKSLSPEELADQKKIDRFLTDKGQAAVYGRPRYYAAGWRQGVPIGHKWKIENGRDRPIEFYAQNIVHKGAGRYDGRRLESPWVNIEIDDMYLFVYKQSDPIAFVKGVASTALSVILDGYEPADISTSTQGIAVKFMTMVASDLATIGVKATSLQLGSVLLMASEGWTAQAIASLKSKSIASVLEQFSTDDELDSSLVE